MDKRVNNWVLLGLVVGYAAILTGVFLMGMTYCTPEVRDSQHVLKAEPEMADATDRDDPANASPSVGSMGVGQPADAGSLERQQVICDDYRANPW